MTPESPKLEACRECGMPCFALEYHPYAACLMFKACHDSGTVRANLASVRPAPTASPAPVDHFPDAGKMVSPALPEGASWEVEAALDLVDGAVFWNIPHNKETVGENAHRIVLESAKLLAREVRRLALAVQSQASTVAGLEAEIREWRSLAKFKAKTMDMIIEQACKAVDETVFGTEESVSQWTIKERAKVNIQRALKPVARVDGT